MRVTLISHNAQAGDAIGSQIAARAAFFRERGAEVKVLVESDRRLHPAIVSFTRIVSDPAAVADEARGCGLLIADYGRYYSLLELLPLVAGKGPRILFDYHGVTPPELWDGPSEVLREGQRRRGLVWYADQAVVHSRFMRDELRSATGFPADRVHVLPLWFEPTLPSGAGKLRERLGLTDERILLFVGRLAANKRVPVLIEALALLKNERPTAHAVIIGDGEGVYRRELERCRKLAATHGITDRVHFPGHVSDAELASAYRAAHVFVMPSVHEGCCVPVLEAMAAGVPVIAARAAALPETIAGAGVSFAPDDPADLAQRLRRIIEGEPLPVRARVEAGRVEKHPTPSVALHDDARRALSQPVPLRAAARQIAIIAPRYGDDVLGGAERSLRLIAETLAARGHRVEVFTTGRGDESLNGVRIHRFAADRVDETILALATQKLRRGGAVSAEVLRDFLDQTRQSTALLEAYAARCDEFDACIVGPYGNGLTWEALRIRAERTLLVPCFHGEPLARQPSLVTLFAEAGGMLYHSDAERRLAETELGVHHPNAAVIGTWLEPGRGDALRGQGLAGSHRPYLLYAGRYCREKNVALLLDWVRRYANEFPERFRLAMIGGGPLKPSDVDSRDFGFVSERDRADLFAGAAAVVQLSTNESLSLAALEAWNEGTPVIAHSGCDVLRDAIVESRGGAAVADYEQFRDVLNDLWLNVDAWRARGAARREFVERRYHSRADFVAKIEGVIAGLDRPLAEMMRERGLELAARRTPVDWQRAFAERIDAVLDSDPIDAEAAAAAALASPGDVRLNARLADAATLAQLPDGYEDVSEGPMARWKQKLKRKLLHQFQASYVDVLSRQQSEMNRVLLGVIRELAERVELLERRLDDSFSGKPKATAVGACVFGLPLNESRELEVSE